MTLAQIQRIGQWHVAHRSDHPIEYALWDAVLTLWLPGWGGWLPALATGHAAWAAPLFLAGMHAPSACTRLHPPAPDGARAHERQRLRCD